MYYFTLYTTDCRIGNRYSYIIWYGRRIVFFCQNNNVFYQILYMFWYPETMFKINPVLIAVSFLQELIDILFCKKALNKLFIKH